MKRILLVRTDRVGDVVYITPAIRELRKTYPDAFIAALTQPHTGNLLENNPHLNTVVTDNLRKETFWEVVKSLRKYKFTDGLLMIPTERAAYQMFWAGIKNRIGTGHKLYEVITGMKSVSRNNYIPLRHEADYCMDLARKIGVETGNLKPEIFLTENERNDAVNILKSNGIENTDKTIIIHTGSLNSAPNWSEEKYFVLIKKILSEINGEEVKVLLTAREMSKGFLKNIETLKSKRVINITQSIDHLRNFIKVISKADVLLCASTGPIHIADALKVKAVGIYCHRPMSCGIHQGLLNKNSITVEVSDEDCNKYCSEDKNTCSIENTISIDTVFNAIKKLLYKN